tara:strand:+ start:23169 stop:23822 length:654 start_codon:yes stop_codon:yes gene_type:complete
VKISKRLENEYYFQKISSLGDFYSLNICFNVDDFKSELMSCSPDWQPYNSNKSWSHRYAISLFSIDGSSDGRMALNSIREWNIENNTNYSELDFNIQTKYWKNLTSLSDKFSRISDSICRSHLLRLDEGGIFPPHRDSYGRDESTFRLISFFECGPDTLHLTVDNRLVQFIPNRCYFLNTRKIHSVVSFAPNSYIMVLNIRLSNESVGFVLKNLSEP